MDELENSIKLPYTVAFLLPKESLNLLALYRRKLAGCCQKFEDLETAHLTVKYLGYASSTFTEKHVTNLIPKIANLVQEFLPVEISVRGLDIFYKNDNPCQVVYLKVLSTECLGRVHESIRNGLGNQIDDFPHADGMNFKPHITVSKEINLNYIDQIRKIVFRSKKTAKRMFRLMDLVLLTPNAIYPIFPQGDVRISQKS